jgi:hypothetical protein
LEIILINQLLVSVKWDYDRFAESKEGKRASGKYFEEVQMGMVAKPTMVVDTHGKIIMWYLPGLLLPQRVVSSTAPIPNILFLLLML